VLAPTLRNHDLPLLIYCEQLEPVIRIGALKNSAIALLLGSAKKETKFHH
jgi:hypothetical protein